MNGSVITPMNRFMALKVVCCEPVASLAGDLRQAGRRQRAEHHRNAAGGVEEIDACALADVLLVDVEAAVLGARSESQREIEIGVVGVVAEARVKPRRQIGVDQRCERAADAAGAFRMVYCFAT